MKVSLPWLKRFVNFKQSASELADLLTMLGFESEVVTDFSVLKNIVVGEVESSKKHPNADKLKFCIVNDGKMTHEVVCGAPNVATGQKIVFAKVGAVLPGNFKIGKAKIRGIESNGMICSERELGISEEHDGIMVLDPGVKNGTNVADILGPMYDAIDIDITPDKAFALSHRGIARELAAKLNKKLKSPLNAKRVIPDSKEKVKVVLDKKGGCPRYVAGIVNNVKVGPSPQWLSDYLKSVGQKSINNLVDISNFMLLEIGHPTHIFDLDKLSEPTIEVKWAKKGEKFAALDEESYILDSDHLVITDSVNTVALAGIIGGKDSAVSDTTTNVLIESAYFDPIVVRKGSKKLNLLSEASRRFERGADPDATLDAFYMIVRLMEEVAGGELGSIVTDQCTFDLKPRKITLSHRKLSKYTGFNIPNKKVEHILSGLQIGCQTRGESVIPMNVAEILSNSNKLESMRIRTEFRPFMRNIVDHLQVIGEITRKNASSYRRDIRFGSKETLSELAKVLKKNHSDSLPKEFIPKIAGKKSNKSVDTQKWICTIPSFRGDLVNEADLIEEILRCYGYDNIVPSYSFSSQMQYAEDEERPLSHLKKYLSSIGFQQCYNNSLEERDSIAKFGVESLSVMNPSSDRMNVLRTSLHQGLLKTLDFNYKNGTQDILIYEQGTIFEKKGDTLDDIEQKNAFSCLVHGDFAEPNVHFSPIEGNFFLLKGLAENIFNNLLKIKIKFIKESHSYCGTFYNIVDSQKNSVGSLGIINEEFLKEMDILHRTDVCIMDINTENFKECFNYNIKTEDIVLYPIVNRDLNFIMDNSIELAQVCTTIKNVNQSLLKEVVPVDVFESKELKNEKSVLFKLYFQNPKKTLEDNEVNSIIAEIIDIVLKKFNAKLRDQ